MKPLINNREGGESDLILLVTALFLIGLGIAMIYSASAVYALKTIKDSFFFMKKQLLWFMIGFIALLFFQGINYRVYIKYTKVMLLLSLVLLIAILIPGIGISVKGAARWMGLNGIRFQPSEFIKLFMVIFLVKVFSTEIRGLANQIIQLLIPIIIIAITFILIMLQPDFGTAVTLLAVSGLILFVSGFPILYILMLIVTSIPMFYLLIYQVDYRKERFLAFLNPWEDRFGNGYHIIQSFIAFKKGELFGVGLGCGTQKVARLPEPYTDFIFAVIAEESGLIGTVFILSLYCVIFWRGLRISLNATDNFGKLLAIGLTMLIVVQAFINIGVVSGGLPTTGIPLPLISYGGSSLLANMISLGILLNISKNNDIMPNNKKIGNIVWT